MIDLLIFSLPTWAVVLLIAAYVPVGLAIVRGVFWLRDRSDDQEQRLAEQARRDVSNRALGEVLPFERRTDAEVIEFPRHAGGWRK